MPDNYSTSPTEDTLSSTGTTPSSTEDAPSSTEDATGPVCANCGEEDAHNIINGENYCSACVFFCEQCGDLFLDGDGLCINDNFYCSPRCATRAGCYRCHNCGDWILSGECIEVNSSGGGFVVCASCRDEYERCEDCAALWASGDMRRGRCPECAGEDLIHDYNYKPAPQYHKLAYENTVYLGVELELELPSDADKDKKARALWEWLEKNNLSEYLYFKEDNSLRNGIEIVFHPITLKAFHKKFPLKKFMAKVKDLGFLGYQSGRAGIHIHISLSGLCGDDKYKRGGVLHGGALFFYKCALPLRRFSRRRDYHYCLFPSRVPMHGADQEHGRYSAFNMCASRRTAELRLFRSTTAYPRFLACLQFTDAFINYINTTSHAFFKTKNGPDLWADFMERTKKSGQYNQFIKYCKTNRVNY